MVDMKRLVLCLCMLPLLMGCGVDYDLKVAYKEQIGNNDYDEFVVNKVSKDYYVVVVVYKTDKKDFVFTYVYQDENFVRIGVNEVVK